jgi:hypothetical protein
MGMSGKFHGDKPAGFKSHSCWSLGGADVDKDGNPISGNCISCKEWDSELKNGFCRDDSCKRKRQQLAIIEGTAIKIVSDLPNGTKIIYSRDGKSVIK